MKCPKCHAENKENSQFCSNCATPLDQKTPDWAFLTKTPEKLRDRIKKGPLKPEEALEIAAQIASGLGAAHRKGIIHRDIKSANTMVAEKGQAKVTDFGLAKVRDQVQL